MSEENATRNHELQTPEKGVTDWHIFLNENFEQLDSIVEIRDNDEARENYFPKANAKFVSIDTGNVYIGDGDGWDYLGMITEDSLDVQDIKGISNSSPRVGALHQGSYHDGTAEGDPHWSLRFWAEEGLTIHSAVIDTDLSNISATEMPIEFRKYHSEGDTSQVDSVSIHLTGGPQRLQLDFQVPEAGEYVLTRDVADSGEVVPCRRIRNWNGWDDYTRDDINLIGGTHATVKKQDDPYEEQYGDYYYYFFDIEIGESERQVMSPWSPDIEEIYVRPRDPEEEFDGVSPRALWIDTS